MRTRTLPVKADVLAAGILFVLAELQVFLSGNLDGRPLLAAAVAGIVTLSVAVRRRYPAAVGFAVQGLLAATTQVVSLPAGAVTIAWFCALYALTVWTTTRWFVAGMVFFAASNMLGALFDPSTVQTIGPFTVGGVVVMVLLRRIVGEREQRIRLAERERDLASREAVIEERVRIARELHDVIAHHVSMMVVQAGAERRVLGPEQQSTSEVLALIERIGRSALTEMRRLVTIMRTEQGDDLVPQPGIGEVPMLVTQMREAGLPVELRVDGEVCELPVGVELSAYRIVQEGLTNTLKHASGSAAWVAIKYHRSSLEIDIADAGNGRPAAVINSGHGLAGIRERVALYGGAFEAGERPGGGFGIHVLLPVR